MKFMDKINKVTAGRQSEIRNSILKVYGIETFGDLGKILSEPEWDKFIKEEKVLGWVIERSQPKAPIGLVTPKGITWLGFQAGKVVGLRSQAVFPMSDL